MLKLPPAAYDWAHIHLLAEVDTDLFLPQFEIAPLKYLWPKVREGFADFDLDNIDARFDSQTEPKFFRLHFVNHAKSGILAISR